MRRAARQPGNGPVGEKGVALVKDPASKPRLSVCGDHFRTKTHLGYFLGTADEDWHVAAPGGEGPATAKRSSPGDRGGSALFQPILEDGRIAFRIIGAGKPLVLQTARPGKETPAVLGGKIPLRFAETYTDEAHDSVFFHFEPDRHLADFYFWIANRATGHIVKADDGGNPQRAVCTTRKNVPEQLWRFDGTALVSSTGRRLVLAETPSLGAVLQTAVEPGQDGGFVRFRAGSLHHTGDNGKFAIAEETRGSEPVLTLRDAASPQQEWALIPYQAAPRYGVDRSGSFEGRAAFMIVDCAGEMAWTRDGQDQITLTDRAESPTPAQSWVYFRGYIYSDDFRKILVSNEAGRLVCVATANGSIPTNYLAYHWGMTSAGYLVPRAGGNRVASITGESEALGAFDALKSRCQRWNRAPIDQHGTVSLSTVKQEDEQTLLAFGGMDDRVYVAALS